MVALELCIGPSSFLFLRLPGIAIGSCPGRVGSDRVGSGWVQNFGVLSIIDF